MLHHKGKAYLKFDDLDVPSLLREWALMRRKAGYGRVDLTKNGNELFEAIHQIIDGTIKFQPMARACELIAGLSPSDYRALKRGWGLQVEPEQLYVALPRAKPKSRAKVFNQVYMLALENLYFLQLDFSPDELRASPIRRDTNS